MLVVGLRLSSHALSIVGGMVLLPLGLEMSAPTVPAVQWRGCWLISEGEDILEDNKNSLLAVLMLPRKRAFLLGCEITVLISLSHCLSCRVLSSLLMISNNGSFHCQLLALLHV